MNPDIISEITSQDYAAITGRIRRFITAQLDRSSTKGLVLGLSGGIDSAVLAYLCRTEDLLGRTLALIMPDTRVTPDSETADAQKIISILGMQYKLIDINPIVREYTMYLEPSATARANLSARVRSDILYYYANAKDYLVLGSSDRSEYLMGYFTKYGDGASDLMPITSLYKLQVCKLAEHLEVPEDIISKKSSPHLRKGDVAEDELGASYEEIDSILWCMIEKGMSASEAARAAQTDMETAERIGRMYTSSMHKRTVPATESGLSFGGGTVIQ